MLIAAGLLGLILGCMAASVLTASLARIAARADDVRQGRQLPAQVARRRPPEDHGWESAGSSPTSTAVSRDPAA